MVDCAMKEKLGTTGRDGGLCDGRETWYNRKEMVDRAMGEKLGTTERDGGLCDGRETW